MDKLHGTYHDQALTLPCFPSCENCLAWSDDALALAGGSSIYLLTRKPDLTNKLTWSQNTLRVDSFTPEEHAQPNLAPISDLSLGEEQLDSVVVALAWSSPGLGLHSRAVLAVLTSNSLLSIWETNGLQRGWRRSCIINRHLPTPDQDDSLQPALSSRRCLRIRSFAWSDPFIHTTELKWGSQFLSIVDDNNNLLFCRIEKSAKNDYGQWSVTVLSRIQLGHKSPLNQQDNSRTSMQQVLAQRSTVISIYVGSWSASVDADTATIGAKATISCEYLHSALNPPVSVQITISEDSLATEASQRISAVLREFACSVSNISVPQSKRTTGNGDISYQLSNESEWKDALENACHNYSMKNDLNGLFRVRFRGYAVSPHRDVEATCVTLHPWDMYEYTPLGSESCYIVFRALHTAAQMAESEGDSEITVLEKASSFISNVVASRDLKWNALDRKLLQAYRSLALSQPTLVSATAGRGILNAALKMFGDTENGTSMVNAYEKDTGATLGENCAMCGSTINMTLPISSAACQLGHHFIRCSLSLILIQEPGISKRCSGCSRQFLDIPKLGSLESPSLAEELFDEFDVCPYCKEKYQG